MLPPRCGVVANAPFDFNQRFLAVAGATSSITGNSNSNDKFLGLAFAVRALLDVQSSCVDVEVARLLLSQQPTETPYGDVRASAANLSTSVGASSFTSNSAVTVATPRKSITLQEFTSMHAQLHHTALRYMRDSWTRLAAKRIQQHCSQAQHPLFHVGESSRVKYGETPLRRLLQRVGYMIETSLRHVMSCNFHEYTQFIEAMASFRVEVASPSGVRVMPASFPVDVSGQVDGLQMPIESSTVPTHQPLFRVELVISTDKRVLNQALVDEREAAIKEWHLSTTSAGTKDARPSTSAGSQSHACPLEKLEPQEGHQFELVTSPEAFRETLSA